MQMHCKWTDKAPPFCSLNLGIHVCELSSRSWTRSLTSGSQTAGVWEKRLWWLLLAFGLIRGRRVSALHTKHSHWATVGRRSNETKMEDNTFYRGQKCNRAPLIKAPRTRCCTSLTFSPNETIFYRDDFERNSLTHQWTKTCSPSG